MTVIENLKGRFQEVVKAMTPRDRRLFVGMVVLVPLLALLALGWAGRKALADVESRIVLQEEALGTLRTLAAEQASGASTVASIEAELRRHAGQDLPSFVEKAAQKSGLSANLQGVRERSVTTEGTLEEKAYGVDLGKVTLQQLVDFLYEIETTGYPLKVRSMKAKLVTVSGQKLLNVSFEVSAFRLVEEAAEAAGGAE